MDMMAIQPTTKIRSFARPFFFIAGVDEETLRDCPQHDWDNVWAVVQLMMCTWLYQTGLFSIISQHLFAPLGQLRPGLLAVSVFLATFIMAIDSYMVMRSGWHLSGIQELKRGGIDVSGGLSARVRAGIFLTIRIILSIGIAQLTAIFLSLLIFSSDITARLEATNQNANTTLTNSAAILVDGEIQQADDAVKIESIKEAALAAQVSAIRQNQIDPSAGDAQIQLAQQEVTQLLLEKTAADQVVQQDETSASDELGGIKSPGSSGIPGDGPRRRAALEAVGNAKVQDQQIGTELETAQSRIDTLRSQSQMGNQAIEKQSRAELPTFQNTLAAEDAKLASMKNALAALQDDRDDAIRAALEASPNYVPLNNGLLAQLTALDDIGRSNPKIKFVVILVDVTSFGFELAAVLAKVTSYVPTTYAALLARSAYMQVVRIVDEMMDELNAPREQQTAGIQIIPPVRSREENQRDGSSSADSTDLFAGPLGPLSAPPKRRRGRPRKTPPVPLS